MAGNNSDQPIISPKKRKHSPLVSHVFIFQHDDVTEGNQQQPRTLYEFHDENHLGERHSAEKICSFAFPEGWDSSKDDAASGGNQSKLLPRHFRFCLKDVNGKQEWAWCIFNPNLLDQNETTSLSQDSSHQGEICICLISDFPWHTLFVFVATVLFVRWRIYYRAQLKKLRAHETISPQAQALQSMPLLQFDEDDQPAAEDDNSKALEPQQIATTSTTTHEIPQEDHASHPLSLFIDTLNKTPFPFPGETFEVRASTYSSLLDGSHFFTRPNNDEDAPLSSPGLKQLFDLLSTREIILIFQSLLEERRILICGDDPSLVSMCCIALLSLLYPFNWLHIFIPILPRSLIDYVCAPMPFLIGIHSSFLPHIEKMPLEPLLLIDLNKNSVNCLQNQKLEPPPELTLPNAHKLYMMVHENLPLQQEKNYFDASAVQRAFFEYLLRIFSKYRAYMQDDTEGNLQFNHKAFFHSNPKYTNFLFQLRHSQLYEQFIEERIKRFKDLPTGSFENECAHRHPELYNLIHHQETESKETAISNRSTRSSASKPRLKRWANAFLNRVSRNSSSSSRHIPIIQHGSIVKNPTIEKVARGSANTLSQLHRKSVDVLHTNKILMSRRTHTLYSAAGGPKISASSARMARKRKLTRNSAPARTPTEQDRQDTLQVEELMRHKRENSLLSEEEKDNLQKDQTDDQYQNDFQEMHSQMQDHFSGDCLFSHSSTSIIYDSSDDLMDFMNVPSVSTPKKDEKPEAPPEQEDLLDTTFNTTSASEEILKPRQSRRFTDLRIDFDSFADDHQSPLLSFDDTQQSNIPSPKLQQQSISTPKNSSNTALNVSTDNSTLDDLFDFVNSPSSVVTPKHDTAKDSMQADDDFILDISFDLPPQQAKPTTSSQNNSFQFDPFE